MPDVPGPPEPAGAPGGSSSRQQDDDKALEAHRASPHFEKHVQRGLFRIIESRTPDTWIPLQLPGHKR